MADGAVAQKMSSSAAACPPPPQKTRICGEDTWEGNTSVQTDEDAGVHKGSFSDKKIRNQIGEAPPKET